MNGNEFAKGLAALRSGRIPGRLSRSPKPRLTSKILDGINSCTSMAVAGLGDGGDLDADEDAIIAADNWVKAMISHKKGG